MKDFFKQFMIAYNDQLPTDDSIIKPPAGGGSNPTPPEDGTDPTPPEDGRDTVDPSKFLEALPEDLRTAPELQRVKSLEDLAKNYLQSQKFISGTGRVPKEDAPQEEWDSFYEKLGMPKTAEEYTVEIPKEYTESGAFKVNEEYMTEFKKLARDKRLTNEQAQSALTFYADMEAKILEARSSQIETEMANNTEALKKEWRGSYTQNIEAIQNNITRLFPGEALDKLKSSGLLRDAEFIKSLHGLTKIIAGDTVYIEGESVDNVSSSLEDKVKKRDQLMADDYRKNHTQVQVLNQEIAALKQAQYQQMIRRRV